MQIDFVSLCRDYGIKYKQEVEGWTNVTCPYHPNGDRGFKGGFNTAGGFYHCWACGSHNIIKVLHDIADIPYREVDKILDQYSGTVSIREKLNKKKSLVHHLKLPIDTLDSRCKRYITTRNFDPDYIAEKYKVVGMTLTGEWAGRLIIPIFYKGKLVSWQGRSLLSKRKCAEMEILRYKILGIEQSVVDPKSILYNIDNCKNDYIVIMEGAFDVWRWGNNAVGTLGTSTTNEQKALMIGYKRIIILFDPEKEAQERAHKLANDLTAGFYSNGDWFSPPDKIKIDIVDTELGRDPGDMNEKEIMTLKKELRV